MKETKFTPGPWKAHSVGERYIKGDEIFEIHWSEDGECVAEIVHGAHDANLIAAAPELYEALLVCAEAYHDSHPKYQMAQSALKKARGEV